jgi:drug/metabolite transporter (DMT)-like permease
MTGHRVGVRVWTALLVVYLVWGSTYLGIKVAMDTLPPLLMLAIRFLIAGAILYAVAGRGARPTWREWRAAALIGTLLLAAGTAAVALAERRIGTGLVALIVAIIPLWMALLDRVFWRRRLSRLAVVGIVVGLGGIALLVNPGGASGRQLVGALIPVFGGLCWAVGSLYARSAPTPSRPLLGAAMQMIGGGLVLLVASAATGEFGRVHAVSAESVGGIAYLVVFGSLVAYPAYAWLIRRAPTTLVSTYAYVNPVIAVLLGAVFLGEPITLRTIVGGAVTIVAVALIVTARPRPAPVATEPALEPLEEAA